MTGVKSFTSSTSSASQYGQKSQVALQRLVISSVSEVGRPVKRLCTYCPIARKRSGIETVRESPIVPPRLNEVEPRPPDRRLQRVVRSVGRAAACLVTATA